MQTQPSRFQLAALIFILLSSIYALTYSGLMVGDDPLFVSGAESLGGWGEISLGPVYNLRGPNDFVEPGQALVGALVYQFTRLPGVGAVHVLLWTNVFATALTAVAVFGLTSHYGFRPSVAAATALVYGLATLAWPHSKTYARDPLAALAVAWAALSFELTFTRRGWRQAAQWGVTLLCVLLGALAKNTAVFILPVFLLVAFLRAGRRMALIGLAGLGAVGLMLAALPFAQGFMRVSPAVYANTLVAMFTAPWGAHFGEAVLGLLFSPGKGLFVESPVLLLALLAPFVSGRREWRGWLTAGLMVLALTLGVARLKDYIWWGGVGWGVRHMLPAVPLLAVACAPVIETIWQRAPRWGKFLGGALLTLSGGIQLGAALASLTDYYAWVGGFGPQAAWTLALWDFRYSEIVGYWRLLLQGAAWNTAWARVWADRAGPTALALALWSGLLLTAAWGLKRAASASPRPLFRGGVALSLLALCVAPYVSLRAVYPDPAYYGWRAGYHLAADALRAQVQPGDAVVVRGGLHPVWLFFLNYARLPVPWYSIDAAIPDETQWQQMQDQRAPGLPFSDSTLALFQTQLPARYQRIWLVNDMGAPGADRRAEEWWLAQHSTHVATTFFDGGGEGGRVAVSQFALTAPPTFQAVDYRVGEALQLTGFQVLTEVAHPGEVLPVSLQWRALSAPQADMNIGVYLLDEGGVLRVQRDAGAVAGFQPTGAWRAGEVVVDGHGLLLPADLSPGNYRLMMAVYDWQTGARWPVVGPAGPAPDNLIELAEVTVAP